MSDKVLLGIIDNKRPDFLDATIASLEENLVYNFLILYISRRVDGRNKLLMSFGILGRKSIIVN
jgi:hypothetical protein